VLEQKRGELAKWFESHKNAAGDIQCSQGDIQELNDREKELKTLQEKFAGEYEIWQKASENADALSDLRKPLHRVKLWDSGDTDSDIENEGRSKTPGKIFTESKAFKDYSGGQGPVETVPLNLKTILAASGTPSGYPPEVLRSGKLVYSAQAMPGLIDLVPFVETTQNGYKYMLETVFTNAAAETAEAAAYGESALNYAEQLVAIQKIATFIPLTDEQLADEPGIRDIIDNRLALMIRLRLNTQIVSGNGTAPNLKGILNTAGIQTTARNNAGGESNVDALYRAMVLIMTGAFADPSGIWLNPTNWQTIRLSKNAQGSYLFGDPAQPGPTTIFGLPVAQHVGVTVNTGIVGDFATYSQLVYRAGIEFQVSNSHSDYFTKGLNALRAQMRCAFLLYRPAAFTTVTALN
jgi:HK97 family phage major capsid protein